jgi:hypothetical protein
MLMGELIHFGLFGAAIAAVIIATNRMRLSFGRRCLVIGVAGLIAGIISEVAGRLVGYKPHYPTAEPGWAMWTLLIFSGAVWVSMGVVFLRNPELLIVGLERGFAPHVTAIAARRIAIGMIVIGTAGLLLFLPMFVFSIR